MGTERCRGLRLSLTLLASVALLHPTDLLAQAPDRTVQVDARGGIAAPLGDTRSIWETGFHVGLGVTYWLGPHFGLNADGSLDGLSGSDAGDLSGPFDAPDTRFWRYTGGVVARAFAPDETRWRLDFRVGGGAATIAADDFSAEDEVPGDFPEPDIEIMDFSETYAAVNGGVTLGYQFSRSVAGFVGARAAYIASKEEDFREFAGFDPEEAVSFSPLWTVPLHGGVAIEF